MFVLQILNNVDIENYTILKLLERLLLYKTFEMREFINNRSKNTLKRSLHNLYFLLSIANSILINKLYYLHNQWMIKIF